MPLVGFGTFMLNGEICTNSVVSAIQNGYRMIDTAEAYGNEKEVGEGIKASGIDRKELFLVTKVNFTSYENAEQSVMRSLENLQTDYIDLVLLHWPFANYYAAWRSLKNCMRVVNSGTDPVAFSDTERHCRHSKKHPARAYQGEFQFV